MVLVWANIKPKLISLLEARRVERLEKERKQRKLRRHGRLWRLLNGIKDNVYSPLTLKVRESGLFPDAKRSYNTASRHDVFPGLAHTLVWPLVEDLYETDSTPEEMEARFEKHREEIEALINEWRDSVQAHFLNQAEANSTVLRPVLTNYHGSSDPFVNLSDDFKRLLRADSIFYTTSAGENQKFPSVYSSIVSAEGWIPPSHVPDAPLSPKPLHLEHIFWYPEAHEAARALLVSMGKPNVSYHEIKGFPLSKIYMCGRCYDTDGKTWEQMVYQIQHYVEQKQMYSDIQRELEGLVDHEIVCNDIHDPALNTDLPMIEYYDLRTSARIPDGDEVLGRLQVCKVCEKIPSAGEPRPLTSWFFIALSPECGHFCDEDGMEMTGIK
ncbi:hypothetical protein FRC11_014378, partial [Ceratobasidium sp. 423]